MKRIERVLNRLYVIRPECKLEGFMNLWIVKPTATCRGYGIEIFDDLDTITKHVSKYTRRRFVVQKYIGKYNCKMINDKFTIFLNLFNDCSEFRASNQNLTYVNILCCRSALILSMYGCIKIVI